MKTDTALYEDISAKLNFTPNLDNSHIAIAVSNGIVKLEGKVYSLVEKRIAETSVKKVSGVKGIANELRVEIPEKYQIPDSEIAANIVNSFKWNIAIPDENITVVVEDGHVTLSGSVEWWYQRHNAEKVARKIMGVKAINNQIIIKTRATTSDVKSEIIKEFHRNAQIDAQNINVETIGHKIVLSGNVRSWAEFTEAERAAYSAEGVTEVENKLEIKY